MSQLFLGFKFYQDAMKFILFLACVAFFGMAYSVYSYIRLKVGICVGQDLSFTKTQGKDSVHLKESWLELSCSQATWI